MIGTLTAAVLILTVKHQIYDTNFYSLWEATALLAGDHPYRDFFEWGIPLQAVLSALAQRLFGYRIISEFVLQWVFLIAGALIAFGLALRLSRSTAASVATALLGVLMLVDTPIYHYPKLFFYPLAVLLAWRYLEMPTSWRAAAIGLVSAVAFLFRHDHGIYVGLAAALAFALAPVSGVAGASWRASARHAASFAAGAALLLLPWLAVVQASEGVIEYVRTRYQLYVGDTPVNPLRVLLTMDPIRQLIRSDLTAPDADAQQHARLWVEQVSLLVPLGLLASAAAGLLRHRARRVAPPPVLYQAVVAAVFLAVVDYRLFREASYAQVVAPLTGAIAAAFLRRGPALPTNLPESPRRPVVWQARWLTAAALFVLTAAAAGVNARAGTLANVVETVQDAPRMLSKLNSRPPIDAFFAPVDVETLRRAHDETLPLMVLARYVHDCTRRGDRVLVTGSTPFDIGYLIERPIAGGHIYWHKGWRADPAREAQSLAILQRQSVPFALATSVPVLQDLRQYPRILEHFRTRYAVVPGSGGMLLVETDRRATGEWALGLPCFR